MCPSIHSQTLFRLPECPGISLPCICEIKVLLGSEIPDCMGLWSLLLLPCLTGRGRWNFCRRCIEVAVLIFLFKAAVCVGPAVLAELSQVRMLLWYGLVVTRGRGRAHAMAKHVFVSGHKWEDGYSTGVCFSGS